MFDKINWGWRIVIFYSSFVVFMLFMVYLTTTQKIELVTNDYYAKELNHQQQIDKTNRANNLPEKLSWQVTDETVVLRFPLSLVPQGISASILFYRPSESAKDVALECTPDSNGIFSISKSNLHKGVYQIQVDWKAGEETYYSEGYINI